MFKIVFYDGFEKDYAKIIRPNKVLMNKFQKVIKVLAVDPKYPSLKSHKVRIQDGREVWASSISADVRIAWVYSGDQLVILVLAVGRHSGSSQIYSQKS